MDGVSLVARLELFVHTFFDVVRISSRYMKLHRSSLMASLCGGLVWSLGCNALFELDAPPRKYATYEGDAASSEPRKDAGSSTDYSQGVYSPHSSTTSGFETSVGLGDASVTSDSPDASSDPDDTTTPEPTTGTTSEPTGGGTPTHRDASSDAATTSVAPSTDASSGATTGDASSSATTGDASSTAQVSSGTSSDGEVVTSTAPATTSQRSDSDSIDCNGCYIAGACVSDGTPKPDDPCWVCDVSEQSDVWVPNPGVNCGDAPTECSLQDTCNAEGQCAPNHRDAGESCGNDGEGYVCNGQGACASQCGGAQRYCDGQCTDITVSKLHCGACGEVCPLNGACSASACDLPEERSSLDFEANDGAYSLNGPEGACVGQWVNAIGDLDGDGKDEVAVAGWEGGYVIKGSMRTTSLELASMTDEGWFIHDSVDQQPLDGWVRSGGDINGDGRRDLTVLSGGNATPFSVRVLFTPSTGLADVDLSVSTFDGFEITYPASVTSSEVHDAHDFNADGKDDLIAVLPAEVLVIFGKSSSTPLAVDALGFEEALRVSLPMEYGVRAERAGDVNNDGKADIIVGQSSGSITSVIYGRTGPAYIPIDATEPGNSGIKITGTAGLGAMVGPAGDFNGDGFDDVIVGNGTSSWVIFGRDTASVVDVSNLGDDGVHIDGVVYESAAGDVNGDGFTDLMLGNTEYGPDGEGVIYVVFGSDDLTPLALSALGARGQRIEGFRSNHRLGLWIASGDFNGDGFADFVSAKTCLGNEVHGPFVIFGVQ